MGRKPLTQEQLEARALEGDWKAVRKLKDQEPDPPRRSGLQEPAPHEPLAVLVGCAKLLINYDPNDGAGGFCFDFVEAHELLDWFHRRLTHVEGPMALQPLRLQPWQQSILVNLFCWKREDGTRRYRQAFILVPRKNGKTTLCSGIVLYLLYCSEEIGQRIYSAAAEREQAALVFDTAKSMIHQDPGLSVGAKTLGTTKTIRYPRTNSYFKSLSSEGKTKRGVNPSCVITDEILAMDDAELIRILRTAMGAREQPLEIGITTADFQRESVCNQIHDFARRVQENPALDPAFLPVLYEASIDDDWKDPAVWRRVNPNYGVSVKEDYLNREFARAISDPAELNTVLREHLNVRTGSDVAWIDMDRWDECRAEFTEADLLGRPCYAGLDLASTEDLTAFVLIFPEDGNAVLPYFWMPKDAKVMRQNDRIREMYTTWAREGHMDLTPGEIQDYDYVRAKINELSERFEIREVAFDRKGASYLITQLMGDGHEVVAFGQGFLSMSSPSKELAKLYIGKQLRHDGNPVLRWNAQNVMIETDAAASIKPSKKKSTEKIDGIVALVMAIGRMIEHIAPAEWTAEVYAS